MAECAVIGVADELKGQVPVALVVLKAGADRDPEDVQRELVQSVREEVGPVASSSGSRWSRGCPRRAAGRSCAGPCGPSPTGAAYEVPSTIDDPAILDELGEALQPTA